MSKTYIATALRRLVHDRAQGACEYCLMPESAFNRPGRIEERKLLAAAGVLRVDGGDRL